VGSRREVVKAPGIAPKSEARVIASSRQTSAERQGEGEADVLLTVEALQLEASELG
jgi:hypothetical protein